jgi:hypothetical protein
LPADGLFEDTIEGEAVRVPEHHARRVFLQMKEVEALAYVAMIVIVREHVGLRSRFEREAGQSVRCEKCSAAPSGDPAGLGCVGEARSTYGVPTRPGPPVRVVVVVVVVETRLMGGGVFAVRGELSRGERIMARAGGAG